MTRKLLYVSTASILLALLSCNDVSGPSPSSSHIGWAVGNSSNGYSLILHSTDGGSHWTRQGSSAAIPDANLVAVRAVDSLRAYACGGPAEGYSAVLRTTDGGENWERVGSISDLPADGLLAMSVTGTGAVWACGVNNAVVRSTDGGATWTDVSDPALFGYWFEGIYALDDSNIWVCGGTDGSQDQDGIIIHTRDGGLTWSVEGDSAMLAGYPILSISAWDANRAWAVGHSFTFGRTQNGGISWELCLPDTLGQGSPYDANGVTPYSATGVWACLDLGGIFHSSDGGDTWVYQSSVPDEAHGYLMLRICAVDQNNVWSAGIGPEGGIIIGKTQGGTWETQYTTSTLMTDVSFVGSHH